MSDVDAVAERHADRQRRIVAGVVRTGAREWAGLDQADLSGSWRRVGPRLVAVLAAGQTAAAADGADYVGRAVRAQDVDPDPQGRVVPEALAGWAADGRPLDTLLLRTLITTKEGIGRGMRVGDALDLGGNLLSMYLATEVGDAGRGGEGVAMHASPRVGTYVRVMGGRGCARCAILAGGIYHVSTAFLRHPCCQCRNVPIAEGGTQTPATVDAASYFRGLSRAEQERLFTIGGARAIRDGADITSVVNARRGVYTATSYGRRLAATRDSTTRRGLFHQAERRRAVARGDTTPEAFRLRTPRLLPEEIYRQADTFEQALEMLRRYGYLT
ncbi:hypothetical protein ACFO3J_24175 [Streptomyces polygonati]|uniref:Uncharacterized protein n=1 Tax=Streptomyces polygonati TaxID=1617087 RepID=A0ABV8HR84_9ACTN